MLLNERRAYLQLIQEQVKELVEQKQFLKFVREYKQAFDDLINRFVKAVSESTAKEENHLLRLSDMLNEENHSRGNHMGYDF